MTVPELVMAEQVINDVVKEAQSVGRSAPIDDTATTTKTLADEGEPNSPPNVLSNPSDAKESESNTNGTYSRTGQTSPVSRKSDDETGTISLKQQKLDISNQDSVPHASNGDADEHSATESQTVADGSVGSDTDISRPGSVDQSKRDGGHLRTNSSLKKPSTFKSVSVTKNFLAKSAVSAPYVRSGEKPTPPAQQGSVSMLSAKPRLVAKSGASNAPRVLGKTNGATSGPDASKVWNKNQPVPPPPPKQFTDEELKQQYGIHLATRLQADEAGKEAKWADIDDDEEDWAPDTVQWMDGTKSSGAAPENRAPAVEEPKPTQIPDAATEIPMTATLASSRDSRPSVTGGTKTILKPGAHTQPATSKSSLVLKGQPEKPTLVAKPSVTEKKSPWAALPPVEKVPPVQINPITQQPPGTRLPLRDSFSYESGPQPAKEIAPDDFNRSWREERGGRPELFNSQSGRYEPVNEMRRNSVRDSSYRQQPALLQRPLQDGPAEPSAAFQTSRSSADMPTWGRRRNSSNVSGDHGRRMSIDRRAAEMPRGLSGIERRESQSIHGMDLPDQDAPRPGTLGQMTSPSISHALPTSPYGSVTSSGTQDLPTPSMAPKENPVEVQRRLMQDKLSQARLKKQQQKEAEEKEEAEKKERIAKRLAALGPPSEAKPKSKDQSPTRVAAASPHSEKAHSMTLQSPPKPPVPTADGEVAQYGMMKVHHAQPLKKLPPSDTAVDAKQMTISSQLQEQAQTEVTAKASPSLNQQHQTQPYDVTNEKERLKHSHSHEHAKLGQQTDGATAAGAKSHLPPGAWSQTAPPAPRPWSSQVWGAPNSTKERALGNGTFESGYSRGQPRSSSQQQLPEQTSQATPSIGLSLGPHSASQNANQMAQLQPMYPQSASLAAPTGVRSRPGPIAPPIAKGWANFQNEIREDDAKMLAKARQDRERLGEAFRPEMRETYKGMRGEAQSTLHDKVGSPGTVPEDNLKKDDGIKHTQETSASNQPLPQSTPLQQANGTRASRFFPRPVETATLALSHASDKADSPPPPPETSTHPAFTGDSCHPLVRLPRPSPVVRLPPSSTGNEAAAEPSVQMSSRGQSFGARPLVGNPEWQARFNKLLEKPGPPGSASTTAAPMRNMSSQQPTAPARAGALAPAAISKASLEVRNQSGLATVSLPSSSSGKVSHVNATDMLTTVFGAEALFEDREFGSLPTVRLSSVPHLAANEPISTPPKDDLLPKFKRMENPFTIRRLEAFDLEKFAQKVEVVIRLPNMREAITKDMPRKRTRGPRPVQSKAGQNSSSSASSTSTRKERSRKSLQPAQTEEATSSARSTSSSPWNKGNQAAATSSPTTWARRAAAPVH